MPGILPTFQKDFLIEKKEIYNPIIIYIKNSKIV